MPAQAAHFTGRDGELARLDALLAAADPPPVVVLAGAGGVGKSALALRWAHGQDRFADGQLWLDLGGFGPGAPLDPAGALGALLRALGVPPEMVPPTTAERAGLYRSVTAGRALLTVLDNAHSAEQVRPLIPASAAGAVLVTSRSRLAGLVPDGARILDLAPLPAADGLALLARAAGPERIGGERAPARAIAELCGGLPLALCVAAARLAARPRLSVARVAAELADETTRLAALAAPEGPSVRAVFDVSVRHLHPGAAALYRRLALHPGAEFSAGVAAAVAATIPGCPPGALDRLLQASLLDETEEDRFRYHDLLRVHALDRARTDETDADRRATVELFAEWYLLAARRADARVTPYRRRPAYTPRTAPAALPSFAGRNDGLDWLEREYPNLVAAGRAALDHDRAELAWHLADAVWPVLLFSKPAPPERAAVDRHGLAAARRWGHPWAEAVMLKRLGRSSAKLGDLAAAEAHTRAAVRRYADAGDLAGALDAREGLAAVHAEAGRPEEAATELLAVLAGNRRLGRARGTALTLVSLGRLLPGLGRAAEAVPLLREARAIFAAPAGADPYNAARATLALAAALLAAGDAAAAERPAAEAADRLRDLGAPHEHAEALTVLARVARRLGDPATARRHYRAAVDLFTAAASPRAAAVRAELDAIP
ncbi:tetratricopeptide repeat protein [Dactylosporangium sp. CA-092794]|uniref:tetratricopeptide repeat protein n=1 Tax=Dactylosporangium sp. CA-092794 TaxID=3239929 RepID=UPI003D905974